MAVAKGDTHKGAAPKKKKPTTFLLAGKTPGQKRWEGHFLGALGRPKKDPSTSGNTTGNYIAPRPPSSVGTSSPASVNTTGSVGTSSGGYKTTGRGNGGGGGSKGGRGGRGNGSGRGGYSGFGGRGRGTNKSLMQQAQHYVNKDIRSAVDALQSQKHALKDALQFQNQQANAQYNRAEGDLNHIFGEANEQNQLQTKAILDRLAGMQTQGNQLFDQLGVQQNANTENNQAALLSELGRLGIQQSADLGQFRSDAAFARNMAEQGRTNNAANLNMMGQGAADIGSLISQTANSSLASNLGKQLNLRNNTRAQNTQDWRASLTQILDAIKNERSTRGNRTYDMYKDLESQAYDRWFQNREANRANRLGWSNFNLSASQANADNMFRQAGMEQDAMQQAALARAQRAQLEAYGNQIPSALAQILGMNG